MAEAAAELTERDGSWPADPVLVARARAFVAACTGRTVIACDADVDGLASAVILERVVRAAGAEVHVLPAGRGEHVHGAGMRERIRRAAPERLIVADMGSRPEPILPDVGTLVIDHHHAAAGLPPGALVVNGFDRAPVATASVLSHVICKGLPGSDRSAWLGALGAVADLGSAGEFTSILGMAARGRTWSEATALLNAARRAERPDPAVALELLRRSDDVREIVSGVHRQTAVLRTMQEGVRREIDRCSRVAPAIAGDMALLRFSSGAQVHPVVAMRWAGRLKPRIVIAANDGYLPGRTNFAIRCGVDRDLIAWLRGLPFRPATDAEFARGHRRATGGSLSRDDFARFLQAAGFAGARAGAGARDA